MDNHKIADMVLELAGHLPNREGRKFVICMDNYFTIGKDIDGLRHMGIACVGTSRVRKGWPPKEVIDVSDNIFNTLYHLTDSLVFFVPD